MSRFVTNGGDDATLPNEQAWPRRTRCYSLRVRDGARRNIFRIVDEATYYAMFQQSRVAGVRYCDTDPLYGHSVMGAFRGGGPVAGRRRFGTGQMRRETIDATTQNESRSPRHRSWLAVQPAADICRDRKARSDPALLPRSLQRYGDLVRNRQLLKVSIVSLCHDPGNRV